MKHIAKALLLVAIAPQVFAQGAGSEWETLDRQAMRLYHAGDYARGIVVAKKAMEVADRNDGKNHPAVAAIASGWRNEYRSRR